LYTLACSWQDGIYAGVHTCSFLKIYSVVVSPTYLSCCLDALK
jgi:hypothetical protein